MENSIFICGIGFEVCFINNLVICLYFWLSIGLDKLVVVIVCKWMIIEYVMVDNIDIDVL